MTNMNIAQLKIRQRAFINATNLVTYMNKYSYDMSEKNRKTLDFFTEYSEGLPLPSGRWGNVIALALEVNNYAAAEYLIENAERLKLRTDFVVSELGFKNPWSLKDEYLYSLLTYDDKIELKPDFYSDEEYKLYVENIIRNKEAKDRLEKKLSITSEDKKVLSLKK